MSKAEPQSTMGYNRVHQHTHNRGTRRRREGKINRKIVEVTTEIFLNMMQTINLHIQKVQQTSNKRNLKKCTPRLIMVKMLTAKEKILKQ